MLILSDEILESLICTQCKKYLSVKPVKVYHNRYIKCGRCSGPSDGGVNSLYGVLADNVLFRCVNRFDGCNQLLTYGDVLEHEKICNAIRKYDCPVCTNPFEGTGYEVLIHFKENHPDQLLIGKADFVLSIDYEESRNYLYQKNDLLFFLNSSYNKNYKELTLSVNYLGASQKAAIIFQKFTLLSVDEKVVHNTSQKPCSTEQTLEDFKIALSEESFPNHVVLCKLELVTGQIWVLPNITNHKELQIKCEELSEETAKKDLEIMKLRKDRDYFANKDKELNGKREKEQTEDDIQVKQLNLNEQQSTSPAQQDRILQRLSPQLQGRISSDVQQHQQRLGLHQRGYIGIQQSQVFNRNQQILAQNGLFGEQLQQQFINQAQGLFNPSKPAQQPNPPIYQQPISPTAQQPVTSTQQQPLLPYPQAQMSSFPSQTNPSINFGSNYLTQGQPQLIPEQQKNSIVFPSVPASVRTPSGSVIQHHTQTGFNPQFINQATQRNQFLDTRPTADPIDTITEQIRQFYPEKDQQRIKINPNPEIALEQCEVCSKELKGKMGKEIGRGVWNGKLYRASFPLTIDGRHYMYGQGRIGTTRWWIAEILPTGQMGEMTSQGYWEDVYSIAIPLLFNDRQFVFGYIDDVSRRNEWFIREILPGGIMGKETNRGEWNMRENIFYSFTINGTYYFFASSCTTHIWFVQELLPDGRLGKRTSQGMWMGSYDVVFPYSVNGRHFIYRHSTVNLYWSILELLPGGEIGETMSNGQWNLGYKISFPFGSGSRQYIYCQSVLDGKNWFIRELLPDGQMGEETDYGWWNKNYETVFPFSMNGEQFFFGCSYQDNSWIMKLLL